jgi:hypothetical protein
MGGVLLRLAGRLLLLLLLLLLLPHFLLAALATWLGQRH